MLWGMSKFNTSIHMTDIMIYLALPKLGILRQKFWICAKFCMPLQSCSLLWGLEMLSNCISISTRRVLVLVLVSAHARRKQGRFERWGHLPEGHHYGGYGSKPTGAAKQIPPYGSEGYILVSTNWLLWLAFRRTNMARSIGVKWRRTSTFSSLKHWSF